VTPPDGAASVSQPALLLVGVRGLCPRCGAGGLFRSAVAFAPRCRNCGLDHASFNVGDGPAALLILVIGALVVGLAITVELVAHPPFWVHPLLWIPLTGLLVVGGLRVAKALLLALEYRNAAREGRLVDRAP
jgi:uncharacterized protein (DUF983 family)